jgi:hypothetical protein
LQGLNAKASLAAFLQSQSQQQQIANLLQQQQSAVNNKNNNNNNNKRNNAKSIVLGQQQAAIVLNQLNLQKQKASVLNGVAGHQRLVLLLSAWMLLSTEYCEQGWKRGKMRADDVCFVPEYFPYFEKVKGGLQGYLAVCVSLCPSPNA